MFVSKVFVVFVALLVSSVIAAPVLKEQSPDELQLLPRSGRLTGKAAVIAVQIKNRLRPKPGKAVFWSRSVETKKGGVTVSESANRHAEDFAKSKGKEVIHHSMARVGVKIPKNIRHQGMLWRTASKVFAKHASGDTHAVLGSKLAKKNVYETIEKPILLKNSKVNKLTEHNAETGVATVVKDVLYKKSKFPFDKA